MAPNSETPAWVAFFPNQTTALMVRQEIGSVQFMDNLTIETLVTTAKVCIYEYRGQSFELQISSLVIDGSPPICCLGI